MSWSVRYTSQVRRTLRKMDPQQARRLRNALAAVAELDDPRSRGKSLTGPLSGQWRYRVGDWRIICDIHDAELVIIAVDVGHRSDIYE